MLNNVFSDTPIQKNLLLRDKAYEILIQAIRENRLKPGQRIVESQVAETLQISRGPIHEAIVRLVTEGLLITSKNNVTHVAPLPSLKKIADNYSIRSLLQGMAARLAAENANNDQIEKMHQSLTNAKECLSAGKNESFFEHNLEFHELIEIASGSETLQEVINFMRNPLYKRISHKLSQIHRVDIAQKEHETIFALIRTKDGEGAEDSMKSHVMNARQSLVDKFETVD